MARYKSLAVLVLIAVATIGCGQRHPAGITAAYLVAVDQVSSGQWAAAAKTLEAETANNPWNADAQYRLALAQQQLGNHQRAIAAFSSALESEARITEASFQPSVGSPNQSKVVSPADQERAVPLRDDRSQVLLARGDSYYQQGRLREAIHDYTEAIGENKSGDAYRKRGVAFLERGDTALAIDDLSRAAQLAPEDAETYLQRARAYLAIEDPQYAARDFRQALRLAPDRAAAYEGLATCLTRQNDYAGAARCLEEAIALDPTQAARLKPQLVACQERLFTEAENQGRQVRRMSRLDLDAPDARAVPEPNTARGHYVRGMELVKAGKTDDAIAQFSQAVALDDRYSLAHYQLGVAFLKKGSPDTALAALDRAIALKPDFPEAWCARARACVALGDAYHAIEDSTRAIQQKADGAQAVLCRAQAYLIRGDFQNAMHDLEEAQRIDRSVTEQARPIVAQVYRDRGRAQLASQDYCEAARSLDLARATDPSLSADVTPLIAQARKSLGQRHLDARRWTEAIDCLVRARQLNAELAPELAPRLATAYRQRALKLKAASKFVEARADAENAVVEEPLNPENYLLRGDIYARSGKRSEALADFHHVHIMDPRWRGVVRMRLSVIYHEWADEARADGNTSNADLYDQKAKGYGWEPLAQAALP